MTKYQNLDTCIYLTINSQALFQIFNKLPILEHLELQKNELIGSIPNFDKIPEITRLYFQSNFLSGIVPNFSNSHKLRSLIVDNNFFTFENSRKFRYPWCRENQKNIYIDTIYSSISNQTLKIDLKIDPSVKDNNYEWINLNNDLWSMDSLQDMHSNTYTFNKLQSNDAGRYIVKVTNPNLQKLTLESKTISIKVCDLKKDSLELVKLYNSTNGSSWHNKTNWLKPVQKISDWHGVYTTKEGCVRSIILDNNNLNGNIPSLDMNTLDTLILSNNQLEGNIKRIKYSFYKIY